MKQILGILSVIIVLGAVIYVFFGHDTAKDKTKNTAETTTEVSQTTTTTTSKAPAKTSTTMTTTAVD
ncbi:hypothetical protein [Enterococcus wangshanyuanii]|uniref:Uncharacterized protein n=1 Tax=Enterococcus wangshanyuanii TaxID=2005703 RepID=A0ABQ1NQX4_9ENTE|nr:hypothetical protein [Enterococcus wangshanyuanii]GGC83216.1 hypothetical protein GCM10011573_11070 [Enterococcus wangshanyuanii]